MIILILLLSLFLRFLRLDQSLWLDEAINVLGAKNYSFLGMITEYAKADFHPPGYFIILWVWTRFFGFSEISVRIPSVIFGVVAVYLIYLIGKKLYSKNLGLVAALILAVNPLHIYYSQEARMYGLATLAVIFNMFLFIKLVKNEKNNHLILIISNLLMLLSDYVAYLIFPAQFIFLLFYSPRLLRVWFISQFIAFLFFLPWIPVFITQLKIGLMTAINVPVWNDVVGSFSIKNIILTYVKFIIGRISYPDKFIYGAIFLPIGLLFLLLIYKAVKSINNFNRYILVCWLMLPLVLAAGISLVISIYSYFRLMFVLPAFILLISLGIISFKSRIRIILLTLVILIQLVSSFIYFLNPIFQREDWRGLVSFLQVESQDSKILLESSGSFSPFDYYSKESIIGIGALKNFPANELLDLIDLESLLNNSSDVYLIDYLVEISDPRRLVKSKLEILKFKIIEVKNFNGVGFLYHYQKYD